MVNNEKIVLGGITCFSSLLFYWYAKKAGKDATPYLIVGAFVGSLVGEGIIKTLKTSSNELYGSSDH